MSYDPAVHCTVTSTMAALQRLVSRGYIYYVTGEVEASKALALAARFDERYSLLQTTGQRDHARRRGESTFRFIVWPLAGKTSLRWWLLRADPDARKKKQSASSHPLLKLERWRDAREHRLEWVWLYELVKTPVEPKLRARYKRKDGSNRINSQTWTWRIRRSESDRLRASIRHWAQYDDDRIPALIRALRKSPGFRGIRADVYTLYQYIIKQRQKRKKKPALHSRHHTLGVRAQVGHHSPVDTGAPAAEGLERMVPGTPDQIRLGTSDAHHVRQRRRPMTTTS